MTNRGMNEQKAKPGTNRRWSCNDKNVAIVFMIVSALATAIAITCAAAPGIQLGIQAEWAWPQVREPRTYAMGPALVVGGLFMLLLWLVFRGPEKVAARKQAMRVSAAVVLCFLLQFTLGSLQEAGSLETLLASKPPPNRYFGRAKTVGSIKAYLKGYLQELKSGVPTLDRHPGSRERDKGHARRFPPSPPAGGQFQIQLSTHPPGSILFYVVLLRFTERFPRLAANVCYIARKFEPVEGAYEEPAIKRLIRKNFGTPQVEAAAWIGSFCLRLLASLIIVPVYFLCRVQLGQRDSMTVAAISGLIPSLYLFSPHPDQLFPLLACLFAWLLVSSINTGSWVRAFLAGFVTFTGLFFSLAFAAPAAAGFLLWAIAAMRTRHKRLVHVATWGIAGFILPIVLFLLVYKLNMLAVWRACAAGNDYFNQSWHRTYWKWFMFNPVELGVFAGPPVFLAFWYAWFSTLRGEYIAWKKRRNASPRHPATGAGSPGVEGIGQVMPCQAPPNGSEHNGDGQTHFARLTDLLIAVGTVFVLLNLSGKNLGEVGRLWMILMPLMPLVAAGLWERWTRKIEETPLLVAFMQLVMVFALRLTIDALLIFPKPG